MKLTTKSTCFSKTRHQIKTGIKKFGESARNLGFAVALPLFASHMIGCGAGNSHEFANDRPDSSVSAQAQEGSAGVPAIRERDASSPDVQSEEDSQAAEQTVVRLERESEQIASHERILFGESCHVISDLIYKQHVITLDTVEPGPDSVGLWTGNLVSLNVYEPDSFFENGVSWTHLRNGVLRSRFEEDTLELFEGASISVGYALQPTPNHNPCAEIIITDKNPFIVNVNETVDQVVLVEDPTVVLEESLQMLEVSFPDGLWTVQESSNLFFKHLVDRSNVPPVVDLGIFGLHFINSVQPELAQVELVGPQSQFIIPEGMEVSYGNISLIAENIFVADNTNSIKTTVLLNNGEREIRYNEASRIWGAIEDLNGTERTMIVVPTVLDNETLAVYGQTAEIIESFSDGQIIQRDGSNWRVKIDLNDDGNAVTLLSFTRLN